MRFAASTPDWFHARRVRIDVANDGIISRVPRRSRNASYHSARLPHGRYRLASCRSAVPARLREALFLLWKPVLAVPWRDPALCADRRVRANYFCRPTIKTCHGADHCQCNRYGRWNVVGERAGRVLAGGWFGTMGHGETDEMPLTQYWSTEVRGKIFAEIQPTNNPDRPATASSSRRLSILRICLRSR